MIISNKYLSEDTLVSLGCELHNERIKKGISLIDISKKTGLTSDTIDLIEIGKNNELDLDILSKLLDAYNAKVNISISEIL